jgi:uncharacterized delta-60 repeat protein
VLLPGRARAQDATLDSFSPASGPTGTSVVLTGRNFTNNIQQIQFAYPIAPNYVGAPNYVVNSDTQITVKVPPGATTGRITVVDRAGHSHPSATDFTTDNYIIGTGELTVCSGNIYDEGGPDRPVYYGLGAFREDWTTINPATPGAKMQLSFSQFEMDQYDDFLEIYDGGRLLKRYSGVQSPGVVTASSPSGQLTLHFGSFSTNTVGAGYSPPGFAASIKCVSGVPTINGFSPAIGTAGTSVVLTGTDLGNIKSVRFNGTLAPGFVVNSPTQITVAVPAGATSGYISVSTTDSETSGTSAGIFTTDNTLIGIPAITACSGKIYDSADNYGAGSRHQGRGTTISPATPGGKVQLTFTQLTFDGTSHSPYDYDKLEVYDGPSTSSPLIVTFIYYNTKLTTVTATNPTGQLTVVLTRTLPTSPPILPAFSANIACVTGIPYISSFTPASGLAGTSVVLTGLSFTGTTAVTFNGVPAPGFVVNSDTQLTVSVPAGNTAGSIFVTNGVGQGESVGKFRLEPPVISSFTPTSGPAGTSVVITGSYFNNTTAVAFNGTPAPGFSVSAAGTRLTVPVPVGARTGPISVTTAEGQVASAASFQALTPLVSGFTPTSGAAGSSVVVSGSYFTGATAVAFNGTAAPGFVVNSDTQLTVSVPAGATTGPISVTTASGTGRSAASFALPAPTISSFTPAKGLAGTSVVVTGTGFFQVAGVRFNGTAAAGFVANAAGTQLTVSVPAGATPGPIAITTPSGTATSTASFALVLPEITALTPDNGLVGSSVVLGGRYLAGATAVRFNGVLASGFVVNDDGRITVTVPAGATTGPVSVTTASGTGTSSVSYRLLSPLLNTFTPASGLAGTSVVLTGKYFGGTTAVAFNGVAAPGFVVNADGTQLTVSVPVGAASGPIKVTTPSGTGSSATSFVVPEPTITSFTPSSGGSGTTVVITGTNFTGTTAVSIDGTNAPGFMVNSNTQITVKVPVGVRSDFISVTTGTTTISATTFFTNNYWMPAGTITTCAGVLYDPNGTGSYTPSAAQDATTTLIPATAGAKVRLTFTEFLIDDDFYLYDGPDASAPLIGRYRYTSPGTVTATNATGQLTVRFVSGRRPYSSYATGYAATISCVAGVPLISSFTPTSGVQGTSVVLTGTGFTGATAVTFTGAPAPGFVVNSSTQITVSVPNGAIAGPLFVTNAIGTGGSAASFTPQAPVVSSFTPTIGPAGTSVVITGNYFFGVTAVAFNGKPAASFTVNSSTQITASAPVGVENGPLSVTNSLGTGTSSQIFATSIIRIGALANVTTCSGTIYDSGGPDAGFQRFENLTTTITPATPGAKVRITFSQLSLASGSLYIYDGPDTQAPRITIVNSSNVGSFTITATNPTGQLCLRFYSDAQSINDDGTPNPNSKGFAGAISCALPVFSAFAPGSGQAGTSVVLTGAEFSAASAVRFNGVLAPGFVINSDNQITVSVPAGASSGPITVTTAYGTVTSATSFTILQPALTAVSPFIGVPGSVLTLTGTNLGGTSAITFTGSAGAKTVTTGFVVNAAGTQITGIVVPAGAQSGPLAATTAGGTTPLARVSFARARTLAAGGSHTVAVRTDGSLWAWGNNASGQLGLASNTSYNTPQRVGTDTNWASVATGDSHTVAVRTDGSLWAWGSNASGQLGLANNNDYNTPQRVGTGTSWASVAAGSAHSLAVQADGSLYAWGLNDNGQLGLGNLPNQNTPQAVAAGTSWASATAGSSHTVAVRTDGTLWAWGSNASGQLGLGSTPSQNTPQRVGTGTTWASAAAGGSHTLAAQADGSLWAWGLNVNGQLGLGNTTNQNTPQPVGTGTNWLSAAAGDAHSLAVRADGSLWAWGSNASGQLGLGNNDNQNTPQPVAAVTSWTSATAGTGYAAGEQGCGATWAWGLNANGQVGDGSTSQRTSPVIIFNPISLLTFSPSTAGPNSPVTVTGVNLAGLTALTVNGVNAFASVTNRTATGFSFVVPASAPLGAGTVRVFAGCGAASSTAFTVGAPTPILSAVSPAAELPGQAVVLTGFNFTNASTVTFGGVAAAGVTYNSPTSLTAVVPLAATPGASTVVVGTTNGPSPDSPAFEVLQVYRGTAASGCLSTAPLTITGKGGAGQWRYLRLPGAGGAVVAAIEDTRNLGSVSASLNALGTATAAPGRSDDNGRAYLDRSFALTATNKTFTGQAVRVRFFGLASELDRLAALDANATLASLNASQYSGPNENCTLADNVGGEQRLLPAPATMLSGADWFTAQVSVADHFSEFYLTAAGAPLQVLTQAPLLTAVAPVRNRPTALQAANVALTFSQQIAAATAGNVRVFGSQSGGQLVGGGNATASGNTITVDPARPLAPGERVMVTVPATVQSTSGYGTLPVVYEFTAEAGAATATFQDAPTVFDMKEQSTSLAIGDLNNDGIADLVTGDSYVGSASGPYTYQGIVVRLGLGSGQFGYPIKYYANQPEGVSLGDVDNDGDLDVLVGGGRNTGGFGPDASFIYVLLNDGSGAFPLRTRTYAGLRPTHPVLGDLDGDGDLDILSPATTPVVSFNDGSGNFTDADRAGALIPVAYEALDVAVGDLDGDGDLDALIANGNQVSIRLNGGSGTFSGGSNVPVGIGYGTSTLGLTARVVLGDVDGDGDLDLVTTNSIKGTTTSSLSVRLNNGDGTFGGGPDYPMTYCVQTVALGDVNGDGALDLLASGGDDGTPRTPGRATVRLNDGTGAFSGGSDFATGGYLAYLALGDLDGDGTLDLATAHYGNFYAEKDDLYIRYNRALPPTVAGFSPQSGPAGTPVTITGTSLNRVRGVRFGSGPELALITAQSGESLTVLVPVGAASGGLTLTSAEGVASTTATAFTYTPRPAGLLATLSLAGPLEACAPRTLTATAASPAFATGAGLSATVSAIVARPNGKLLLAGQFLSYDNTTVNRILQLNPDGSRDAAFLTGSGFGGDVYALALQTDDKVLVGGNFRTYNGAAAEYITRLNPDGTPDATFNVGTGFKGGLINAIVVQPNGQILVGGNFTSYNDATQNRIIRLNPDGSPDASFLTGTGFGGNATNVALQADGKILVAGTFTSYNGTTGLGRIVRLNANGSLDASFVAGTAMTVQSLAVQADGKALVGGVLTSNSVTKGQAVRLNTDGSLDASFNTGTGFSAQVNAVLPQADGSVLIAGQFTTYNDQPQNRLVRLTATGALDASFNIGTGFNERVRRLLVQADGSVVAAGNYSGFNGATATRLIRLRPNGTPNTSPTLVSGASFTFGPGTAPSSGAFTTSTPGTYAAVASLNGETSAPSNAVTLTACTSLPTLTALSVPAELPGLPVTLTGTGFTAGSTVSIGGVAATVSYVSPTQLTAMVPASATPGSSTVVVTTAGAVSIGAPAFTVLAVYDGGSLNDCAAAVPATASVGDGAWHYLLSPAGQVVAAYNYTGASLGNLAIDALRADPAQPVRQDAANRYYLGRNWHLTASAGRFDGRTVQLRLYGLNSEQARLQVADPTATLANLKATQYGGPNEDCLLGNNRSAGESRVLPAPATSPSGTTWFAAELSVADHFSEFYLTGSPTPLPVELTAFTATPAGPTAVRLAWATASEKNSAAFEVERSLDGQAFIRVGTLAAAGSSATPRSYELLDTRLPAGVPLLYYRLQQVDQDGSFSYSPVRTVALTGASAGLALFPNPAHGGTATLTGAQPGAVVTVLDALGRQVLTAPADAAGTAVLALPPGLASGVYVVRTGSQALRLTVE